MNRLNFESKLNDKENYGSKFFPTSNDFVYLTNDWLLVPALNVVPLDAVLVEVVEDPNATLVLPALLCLPDQINKLDVALRWN